MNALIGIRKEDKDITEKRAPLTPKHVRDLVDLQSVQVAVEPSKNRIFSDEDYKQAGARVSDDLSSCNIIFGVKEIPLRKLIPRQVYCFFSHTIKGQSHNMPMLKRVLDLRNTLIDYEKVTDDKGNRIIFFGSFAGYAGMIDSLWAFGQRMSWEGYSTPFGMIKPALSYNSLADAKKVVLEVGTKIAGNGLPKDLVPLICGFSGYGHVSKGAQEIFDLLPVEEIPAGKLLSFMDSAKYSSKKVYKTVFHEADIVKSRYPHRKFELLDYYNHPEYYESQFEKYIAYLSILINGIYWDYRYPRLVTKEFIKDKYQNNQKIKLRVIGDITCDVEGSIECNVKATNSDNPVYVYEPMRDKIIDGWEGEGPVILAVDKLPSELPREASQSFGESLAPFIPELSTTDFRVSFSKLKLPDEIKRAVIAHDGNLTPDFHYIRKFIR